MKAYEKNNYRIISTGNLFVMDENTRYMIYNPDFIRKSNLVELLIAANEMENVPIITNPYQSLSNSSRTISVRIRRLLPLVT